jgi:hypothetical protein
MLACRYSITLVEAAEAREAAPARTAATTSDRMAIKCDEIKKRGRGEEKGRTRGALRCDVWGSRGGVRQQSTR